MDLVTTVSHSVVRTDSAVGISLLKQVLDCAVDVLVAYAKEHSELTIQKIFNIFVKDARRIPVSRQISTFAQIVGQIGLESLGALVALFIGDATTVN